MKVLGIELSSAVGSIALGLDGEIAARTIATPREQTGRTLALVEELLAAAGLRLRDLDGVAFGRGPGSFTGLRVAAAHAQGFALAAGLPLYPVSSLLALAQGAWRTSGIERVLVCVDARMDEVYCGAFELAGGVMAPVADESIGSAADVAALAEAPLRVFGAAQRWAAVGDGFASAHGAVVLEPVAARAAERLFDTTAAAEDLFPQAERDHAAGRATAPFDALPAYLREATAWRRY